MDEKKKEQLGQGQHKDEILAISEFNFPFPRFDTLPREGVIMLRLQGFGVVCIIGLSLDLAKTRNLVVLITHIGMYTKVQVWLIIGDGVGGWATVVHHQHKYYFSSFFI